MSYKDQGWFIPSTQVWDVSEIYSTEVTSPEFKELLVRMYQNLNIMAMTINGKSTGIYHTDEFVTGEVYPPNATNTQQRPVYRKVIDFGVLPNAGSKTVAHGLVVNANTIWTRIYGCATDPSAAPAGLRGIPLPYASNIANNSIELSVDSVNITITTGIDRTMYTICWVVLEFLKF